MGTHGCCSVKAWLPTIKACIYSISTPRNWKYLTSLYSTKCRTRIVQCVVINTVQLFMYKFQLNLLFWLSTTAQRPSLKLTGIRLPWFYYVLSFCRSDIWIRQSRDGLLVSAPQCLGPQLGDLTGWGWFQWLGWHHLGALHSQVWKVGSNGAPTCNLPIIAA